ncbi:MAG: nitrogen regulation protein NR(I), partial [Alphaproteobacteria bacterium]|nr:nitrogen regulation protein NR(I) [Alphaproteobacteria bacterium]
RGEAAGLPGKRLTQAALDQLRTQAWPGNGRELENLIQRLVALYPEDVIEREVVEAELSLMTMGAGGMGASEQSDGDGRVTGDSIGASVELHLARYFQAHGDSLPPAGLYDRVLHEVERPLIQLCLSATRGNQIRAAELLGLNRNTLRKKIKELDIQVVRGLN